MLIAEPPAGWASEVVRAVAPADDLDTGRRGRPGAGRGGRAARGRRARSRRADHGFAGRGHRQETHPDVAVDFTIPDQVMGNARVALAAHVAYVIGASGIEGAGLWRNWPGCARNTRRRPW